MTIPEGALSPEAEQKLFLELTDLLLEHEGPDPTNETVRGIAWLFLHRPERDRGGQPETDPHYRIVATAPEGQFDPERRKAVVEAVTDAVLDAEEGKRDRDPSRVWSSPPRFRKAPGEPSARSSVSRTSSRW